MIRSEQFPKWSCCRCITFGFSLTVRLTIFVRHYYIRRENFIVSNINIISSFTYFRFCVVSCKRIFITVYNAINSFPRCRVFRSNVYIRYLFFFTALSVKRLNYGRWAACRKIMTLNGNIIYVHNGGYHRSPDRRIKRPNCVYCIVTQHNYYCRVRLGGDARKIVCDRLIFRHKILNFFGPPG